MKVKINHIVFCALAEDHGWKLLLHMYCQLLHSLTGIGGNNDNYHYDQTTIGHT